LEISNRGKAGRKKKMGYESKSQAEGEVLKRNFSAGTWHRFWNCRETKEREKNLKKKAWTRH